MLTFWLLKTNRLDDEEIFFRILLTCINHSLTLDKTKYVDFDSVKCRVISARQYTDIARGRLYCSRFYARAPFVEFKFTN